MTASKGFPCQHAIQLASVFKSKLTLSHIFCFLILAGGHAGPSSPSITSRSPIIASAGGSINSIFSPSGDFAASIIPDNDNDNDNDDDDDDDINVNANVNH